MGKNFRWLGLACGLLVLGALADGGRAAEGMKERWLYLSTNLQTDARAGEAVALLERAKKSGYTHLLIADSKFAHLDQVAANYRPNVERVKKAALAANIEIVPSVFPVGYSNDALFNNPNLAEGLPVKEAPFVVKGGQAVIRSESNLLLAPGMTEGPVKWDFTDAGMVPDAGGLRSGPTASNARLHKKVHLTPFRQYVLSAWIRSEDFTGGVPEFKAIVGDGRQLQWTTVHVARTQEWTECRVTFNSLDATDVGIYFGVWGGHQGTLWWKETRLAECGPVNLLRREGAPLVLKIPGGRVLKEGQDYEKVENPATGTTPWPGSYTAWHQPPVIRTKSLPEGQLLELSYFHTHVVMDEQVCACVEEPEFQSILKDGAGRVADLWRSRTHLMAHDEWRVLGWDHSCRRSGLSPGGIVAKNARFCSGVLRAKVPGGRILVWSDMFDPFHNAVDHYYLVNGSMADSWKGLEPEVDIMNWNFGKRDQSLAFFAAQGHRQVLAGFYDEPVDHVGQWLASAAKTKNVRGFMYTTWRGDYSHLEEVAAILEKAGW